MAKVRADEIPTEAAFMTDLWNMVKATYTIEDNNSYWGYTLNLAAGLMTKYEGSLFARKLILSYLEYLTGQETAPRGPISAQLLKSENEQ